ncbi:DUF3611 family protein [Lyngbya confervoides]|uniref:DUF3611 family protein n=1 Tax=Lyngbya confervoides BDU141951 TaxID=1574623 RepID=A0ABD4T7G8_9CYAN|nr:DUF3611 family protein [Lyngbya confervoides]MCM1984403.1 DUF3611 family protein [Lyngbya confervoides BDU141951]
MQPRVPTRQQFAPSFRQLSRLSFWLHLFLGCVSGTMLVIALLSQDAAPQAQTALTPIGMILACGAFLAIGFRAYWAYRYRHLAQQLEHPAPGACPTRDSVIQALKIGLIVSCAGLVAAFFAAEFMGIEALTKALAQPQGAAIYTPRIAVRSLDILFLLASLNMLGAHLLGSFNSLELLHWITE